MKTIDKIKELSLELETSKELIDSVRLKHTIIKLSEQIPKELELIEITRRQEEFKAAASIGILVDFDVMHYNNNRIEVLKEEINEGIING
tara:strand:- start:953 stop:1222 length:270 start_codon:yes stop_codon:yes gene_type:complete